jgi:predicted nuclease with TOPRIM domain
MTNKKLKAASDLFTESDQLKQVMTVLVKEKSALEQELKILELNSLRTINRGKVIDLEMARVQEKLKKVNGEFKRL